mmetsp:Transcript_38189/g.92879  ORF Transcript_38189/g.92879 Transcript_38189/m.92879 type:complete len:378 (+) Transcript_38189:328-1461(+)
MTDLNNENEYEKSTRTATIPVIDMESSSAGSELIDAFKTVGFATLTNHGVSSQLIDDAFYQSKQFFDLSETDKLKYKYQGAASNRGYIPFQAETHTGTLDNPDRKETFDIGKERDDEDGYTNQWPAITTTSTKTTTTTENSTNKRDFQSTMIEYFENFDKLFLRLMKMVAVQLDMDDPEFLVDRCNQQHENLRLLHYPSIPVEKSSSLDQEKQQQQNKKETTKIIQRGNVHTDFGVLTLLCQDSVGGLRAQLLSGRWINVPPVPNSIVVNVGDMLQRWSNDMFRATPHQVVSELSMPVSTPSSSNTQEGDESNDSKSTITVPERYSIAFFCNANKNVVLECLRECCCDDSDDNSAPRYEPINAHDYLSQRLNDTISA